MRLVTLIAVAAALMLPLGLGSGYAMQVANIAVINAIVVLGLNFVSGWTGQIHFGQAAFYGLGAYSAALAAKAGVPWFVTPFIAGGVAALASLVIGLPTLRLRSYYLAMTTIGFGEIVRLIILFWEPVTGGSSGLRAIPGVGIAGFELEGPMQHYYLLIAFLALAMLVAARLRRSHIGRAMIATRDSEIAAELSGVDTVRTKILAFVFSAVYGGVAGCLYATSIHYISPDSFTGIQAVLFMTMLLIGGLGSIPGAVAGAAGLTVLPEFLRFLGPWYLVLYGAAVIGVIVAAPGGLASVVPVLQRYAYRWTQWAR